MATSDPIPNHPRKMNKDITPTLTCGCNIFQWLLPFITYPHTGLQCTKFPLSVERAVTPLTDKPLLPASVETTRCKGQGARCKGQDQHQHKLEWNAVLQLPPQLTSSGSAGGVHDAAIIATCVRAGHGRNLNCVPLRSMVELQQYSW